MTPLVPLGEFAVARGGSVDPAKFKDEEFDLYSIPAYDAGEPDVAKGSEIGSSKKVVQPGDVLLSRIVPHIRRVWVVGQNRGRRQIASGEWILYRGDKFDNGYLRHFLMADPFHQQFMRTVSGVGGSLLRARPSEVANINVPVPELAEQKRIAAILDKADAIRRKRQQAIELADQFLRAVFLDMFGDPVANPMGWATKLLSDGIATTESGWSTKGDDAACAEADLGVLKISAVTSGFFKSEENKRVPRETIPAGKKLIFPEKGDLLFSRANTRELVAATCIVQESQSNVFIPDKLWRIRTNDLALLPEFLHYLISTPRFRTRLTSQATGTSGSMLNISKAKFLSTEAIFPPIELQRKFRDCYWKVNGLRSKNSLVDSTNRDLFGSLSQRAFSGAL